MALVCPLLLLGITHAPSETREGLAGGWVGRIAMRSFLVILGACTIAIIGGCSTGGDDGSADEAAITETSACGDLGFMPKDPSLTPEQERGRCTWHLFTAGTERLYAPLAA